MLVERPFDYKYTVDFNASIVQAGYCGKRSNDIRRSQKPEPAMAPGTREPESILRIRVCHWNKKNQLNRQSCTKVKYADRSSGEAQVGTLTIWL
jgi:hypothetical protein